MCAVCSVCCIYKVCRDSIVIMKSPVKVLLGNLALSNLLTAVFVKVNKVFTRPHPYSRPYLRSLVPSVLASISWRLCPNFSVRALLPWPFCPGASAMALLSWHLCPVHSTLAPLSWPLLPLTICPDHLSWHFIPGRSVLAVLIWLLCDCLYFPFFVPYCSLHPVSWPLCPWSLSSLSPPYSAATPWLWTDTRWCHRTDRCSYLHTLHCTTLLLLTIHCNKRFFTAQCTFLQFM